MTSSIRVASLLAAVITLGLANAAAAATFTVNSVADTTDGSCDAIADGGDCTLREALAVADGAHTINFSFSPAPAGGPVIFLNSGLVIDEEQITIDGYDCTGCGVVTENTNDPADGFNLSIGPTLDGSLMLALSPLLLVDADEATVRGLNVRNGPQAGIEVDAYEAEIEGCLIGTSRDGLSAAPNNIGIAMVAGDGGSDEGSTIGPFNVISGNTAAGISIFDDDPDYGTIVGNLIGTDITAEFGLGNGGHGIEAIGPDGNGFLQVWTVGDESSPGGENANIISGNGGSGIYHEAEVNAWNVFGNVVGLNGAQDAAIPNGAYGYECQGVSGGDGYPRNTDFEENVFSGNTLAGVFGSGCQNQDFVNNQVGTDSTGVLDFGNGAEGFYLLAEDTHNTEDWDIGGSTADTANIIAFNTTDGIRLRRDGIRQNRTNTIWVNLFYDNGGLAVDIEAASSGDGPTAGACSNDTAFGNRGAARPVITSAYLDGTELSVTGTHCGLGVVGIWGADEDPTGYGEPAEWIGGATVSLFGGWEIVADPSPMAAGEIITALGFDFDQETGESALNFAVVDCDADGDGDNIAECGGGDCDDTDPTVSSLEPEICDGLDNDCDGLPEADEVDDDGDGVMICEGDCDDGDDTISPLASESCNGVDDDCDGTIDEGFDLDGDLWTTCAGDCDDSDPLINPTASEVCDGVDNDCDGLLLAGEVDADGDGYLVCEGDCDDTSAAVNPGAVEVCDGVDNDCDSSIDEGFDSDGDGFTTCAGDCDDTNANIYPGAPELCDFLDDDCDGVVPADESDDDGDGYLPCGNDCDDTNPLINPAAAEVCDGADNDCDGSIDEGFDGDGDGFTTCAGDCDDTNSTINPGATEVCDGIDNDCDSSIDEGFDGDGDGFSSCNGDCDDGDATVNPDAAEVCNGVDDDCDGSIPADEVDGDGDGVSECDGDCDPTDDDVFPGATETCDGVDEDCDGTVDEGFDGDGDGFSSCDGDCDDGDAAVNPDAAEACNGIDDD